MKIRKMFAALGAGSIFACCIMIYLMLDVTLFPQGSDSKSSIKENKWLHFENRLAKLEKDLNRHHEVINALHETSHLKNDVSSFQGKYTGQFSNVSLNKCAVNMQTVPNVDIQMLNVYKQLDFTNPDGGVWKQGWNIKYDEKQWHPNRKLHVFVVPHSHNDPGWLNTFEKYYTTQTQSILNNMVTKLAEDKRRKFIWAEISFFKMWWDDQSLSTRDLVKRLVHDGQLEIVAGGWVMPDESVSHWIAQLTQLTEGHQWLKANLDYVPTNGWAIDPFGLSSTMPYLLKKAGLQNLVIQRVHYSVKKKLAKEKNLEFRWQQLWDSNGSTEIFTHMMPFYSYDIPHTCGPDPKICCQFDFFRLPHFGVTCPWKLAPKAITKSNVAERATLLLDQYRKKAQLFRTNVLLVPLGDDFRYSQMSEWNAQYVNYQKLFDYMNNNEQLNVQIQFGTLKDYFDLVRKSKDINDFPSLSGDFFTYSDRDDHYWSGYYTSRPFHKRLDRVLLAALRGSEILASIAWINDNEQIAEGNLAVRLSEARRWHSLFQHHDGVTGTARDNVVVDYAQKMIAALNNSAHVLQQSITHLLQSSRSLHIESNTVYFSLDEIRSYHTSNGDKHVLSLGDDIPSRKVVLYNSIPRQRTKVYTFFVSTPFVRVTNRLGQSVKCQISPVWIAPATLSSIRYELSFLVTVPGLGLTTYVIHALHGTNFPQDVHLANVTVFNSALPVSGIPGFDYFKMSSIQEFSIFQRPELAAAFGKSGLLKAIRIQNTTFPVHLEFVNYGTRGSGQDKSGAYLFLPDKPKPDLIPVDSDRIVHLITGPLMSKVFIDLPHVRHTCALYNSVGSDGLGLHIFNEVDISSTQNFELAMRLDTDINSGNEFFTDINGLNMIKRHRFSKIPIQGNYYPMAAAAYIQDSRVRMTVLSAQPLGVTSMASGQLEIMQDRRLLQDDNRGLGQGVTDNLLTNHMFTLVMEKKIISCNHENLNAEHPAGLLSVGGSMASEELLHPIVAVHPQAAASTREMNANFSPLHSDLPVDINLISLRVFDVPEGAGKGVGMVIHRNMFDQCWTDNRTLQRFVQSVGGQIDLNNFFSPKNNNWLINNAPLTFHSVDLSRKSPIVTLCPHDIKSILFYKAES